MSIAAEKKYCLNCGEHHIESLEGCKEAPQVILHPEEVVIPIKSKYLDAGESIIKDGKVVEITELDPKDGMVKTSDGYWCHPAKTFQLEITRLNGQTKLREAVGGIVDKRQIEKFVESNKRKIVWFN